MFRFTRFVAGLLAAVWLSGCATSLRIALTPEQRAAIRELDTKVVVIQDEVIVDVRASQASAGGAAFGLIGALIASTIDSSATNSRVQSAQDLMGPFYAAIENVDFRQEFDAAVRPALANYPIKVGRVETTPLSLSDDRLRAWREALQPGQRLMIVVPHYKLSSDFRTFDVETWVTLWQKEGGNEPVNRGVLRYQSAPLGGGAQESIAAWSANEAEAFKRVMRDAIAETMNMVRIDLDVADVAPKPEAQRDFSFLDNGATATLKASVVQERPDRVVVLAADGRLYSLPKATATAAATR